MLDALRRRLILVFSLLTTAVLAAAMAFACRMSARDYRNSTYALYQSDFAAVEEAVTGSAAVEDAFLARQEVECRAVIHIEDNGRALAFPGAWFPAEGREALTALAIAQAGEAGLAVGGTSRQSVRFSLRGVSGGRYTCLAAVVLRRGKPLFVCMIRDDAALYAHLRATRLEYFGIWCLGAAALAGICWGAVRLAIRPTAEALRRQREFVAAAGHELRSPLAVVKASLQAARDPAAAGGALPDGAARFLSSAGAEVERMTRLTGDLLLLAGSDAGVWRTSLAPLPMDAFLIELYDRFTLVARQHGHTLTLSLPDGPLPAVRADAQRLEQLLAVLLNNAFEYAPPGTPVELGADCRKNSLRLTVTDHGPGIPDDQKRRVFDRFYRADASRSDKAHFGLGLSVAAEIARAHAAALEIRDTPGGGATFVLELKAVRG